GQDVGGLPRGRWDHAGPAGARCQCHLGMDRGEQLLHRARQRRAERLVEVDGLRKLLADEIIAPREFAVVCKRLLDAIGVAAAQRPCRVPRQQSLDLMALWLFIDRAHSQPRSIRSIYESSSASERTHESALP